MAPELSRRNWLLTSGHGFLGVSGFFYSLSAVSRALLEEPLADSVRTALSASVANLAPPTPEFAHPEARLAFLQWQSNRAERLKRRHPDFSLTHEFLQTVWYESKRAGLEVSLVLGLIQVESNFRKFAVSSAGARGYMQIMPFWSQLIGDGDASKLFHTQTNLRFGCVILRHYLEREQGQLFWALGRYNGSRGQSTYPKSVYVAQAKWL
jgi:soluble lytic murein transglycosylase-like protein